MLNTLKWVATATLIIGFGLFSAKIEWGWYLQILGGFLWLIAGLKMKDKPIIATNALMSTVGIIGRLLG
jgi:hypothetical protein